MKYLLVLLLFFTPILAECCFFDLDCDIGSVCIKTDSDLQGVCVGGMYPGNSNDKDPIDYRFPVAPEYGDTCQWNIDCPFGFKCYKSGLYGTCLPD